MSNLTPANKPKVYITRAIPERALDYAEKYFDCCIWNKQEPIPREYLLNQLAEIEGLICFSEKINEELLVAAPKLRIVSNVSVGYDNLDLEALTKRKIWATNTPDVLTEATADLVFSLILAAARRIPEADRFVKEGKWEYWYPDLMVGFELNGATLGIVSMGRIGRAIARRAKGFGLKTIYYNRKPDLGAEEELGVRYSSLENLLQTSDIVCVMTPLTKETTHLIGKKEIAMLKPNCIFVNGGRGLVVDEEALIEALRAGRISAAGLDVFEKEPIDKDHPLLKYPNVVTTPHIGSATKETRLKMAMKAIENQQAALGGQRPPNPVNQI